MRNLPLPCDYSFNRPVGFLAVLWCRKAQNGEKTHRLTPTTIFTRLIGDDQMSSSTTPPPSFTTRSVLRDSESALEGGQIAVSAAGSSPISNNVRREDTRRSSAWIMEPDLHAVTPNP